MAKNGGKSRPGVPVPVILMLAGLVIAIGCLLGLVFLGFKLINLLVYLPLLGLATGLIFWGRGMTKGGKKQ